MPKMGDAMTEGTLISWRKQDGDLVRPGEIIAEIETDKSNVEVEAEHAGILAIRARAGDVLPVGGIIAIIGDGRASSEPAKAANGAKPDPQTSSGPHYRSGPPSEHAAATPYTGETVTLKYSEAIRLALDEELERDENVLILGEEIGQYQGTFKVTRDFLDKYGPERIVDTPISEIGMVGLTCGAAMMGMRPVLEFMTLNFALVAWDQIINHVAKIRYMSGGQFSVPCVIRGPGGVGVQLSAQHSQDLAHWYANTPGLKVVCPATPAEAKGLLKSAIRDDDPVVYVEHAGLYVVKGEVPTDPNYLVPIGVADIKRRGTDVTIVSYSRGVTLALAAAEILAAEGIEAEVVDLRSLQPLDMDTVVESVRRTHRAVVVQEQWLNYGIAGEFAAQIMEKAFDDLDAPVERVAGAFVPMPYARSLELLAVPHEPEIVAAVKRTLAHG